MEGFQSLDLVNHKIYEDSGYSLYHPEQPTPLPTVGPIGLLPTAGNESFAKKINDHLFDIRLKSTRETQNPYTGGPGYLRQNYIVDRDLVRFQSGEGKATLSDTVRGHDLFILADVINREASYNYFHVKVPYSPDDHMQDIKRMILASSGKAARIHLVMPYLYQSQQDLRRSRESLDCAVMLKELKALGVSNILTVEPHEPRVENAIPRDGIETIPISYIMMKKLLEDSNDLNFSPDRLMVVSPNESNIKRAIYYASNLGVQLGTFFRQRDYSRVVVGRNPVLSLDYLGDGVKGKDVLLIDDMILTGNTMIETARQLRNDLGAERIFCICPYPLMTNGIQIFNDAYAEGIIQGVYGTNLCYRPQAMLDAPWYQEVDCTMLIAQLIDAINHNASISGLLDQTLSIQRLLKNRHEHERFMELAKNHQTDQSEA